MVCHLRDREHLRAVVVFGVGGLGGSLTYCGDSCIVPAVPGEVEVGATYSSQARLLVRGHFAL